MNQQARRSGYRRNPEIFGSRPADFLHGHGWTLLVGSIVLHLAILGLLPLPTVSVQPAVHSLLISLQQQPELAVASSPLLPLPGEPKAVVQPRRHSEPVPANIKPEKAAVSPLSVETPTVLPPVEPTAVDPPEIMTATAVMRPAPATPPTATSKEAPVRAIPVPTVPEPSPETEQLPLVDVKALLTTYATEVKAQILQFKSYPAAAERLGHQGVVRVGFEITADGSVSSISIKSSSGHDSLDQAALDSVRSADPFNEIPAAARRDSLAMSIRLKFYLN